MHKLKDNNDFMKKLFKTIIGCLLCILFAAMLGTVLMCVVYSVPAEAYKVNATLSAITIENEGIYPSLYSWCFSRLDNYTDALMIMEAADGTDDTLIHRALLNYWGDISWVDSPCEKLSGHYLHGIDYDGTSVYARYWHGYLLLLKPFLCCMPYSSIRMVNLSAQITLSILICIVLIKKKEQSMIIPWLITYLMMMPTVLGKSLQYSSCFYIMTGSVLIYHIWGSQSQHRTELLFAGTGIATAFFDFLTYPITTFGVPAVFYLWDVESRGKKAVWKKLLRAMLCWGIGFSGMWASKWVIAGLLTDKNIILDAIQAVMTRIAHQSVDGATHYSVSMCWLQNLRAFFYTPATAAFLIYVVVFLMRCVRKKSADADYSEMIKQLLPYTVMAALPLVWYALATNHSYVHYFFTNKALAVMVLSVMVGTMRMAKKRAVYHELVWAA